MLKRFIILLFAMFLISTFADVTLAIDMGIVTGGPKGT